MKSWSGYGLPVVLAITVVTVLAGCGGPAGVDSSASNGERIYFTAESSSGEPIYPEGFTMMMHRIACVDCHGPEGKGGPVYMMMQRFEVPDITWPELTGQKHEEGGHEDHPPYTEETLKRAITEGLDPGGQPLEAFMPKWQISSEDLDDLVSFIKTLK